MALVSRHYLIANAILTALKADADLIAVVPSGAWKLQKRAYHRGYKWSPGAYVVPVRNSSLIHENSNLRLRFDTVVAIIWPGGGDESLQVVESRLGAQERVDLIFQGHGTTRMPANLAALKNLNDGTADQFFPEITSVAPGENFISGAFEQGYDAFASVVTVQVTAAKRNSSSLGA